ncbi:hypothetical protein KPL74_10855 [Bacillus sp. NP157]|nr:hypothetical protein KPL74_10855 [Bacillus sp. NP157]
MTSSTENNPVVARYLVSYDWPKTADTRSILERVKAIVARLGCTKLRMAVWLRDKKKHVIRDLFKIEDFSIVTAMETLDDRVPAHGFGDLFYTCNETLDIAVLSIAVIGRDIQEDLLVGIIHDLHEVNGLGYTIGFDADLGTKSFYYALGIAFGEVRTHYENMLAKELGRFHFQRTRKHRDDRAYTRDKVRGIYPINVLNAQQTTILRKITGLREERFIRLDDDRHLLVLSDAEVAEFGAECVGSDFLI